MKRFLPAVMLLIFVTSVMATATYAWFSMNTSGQVTGMAMYATVKDNLMIAPDTLDNTANISDYYFTPELTQVVGATLEPVSTVNGVDFYYTRTNNVNGDGNTINKTYIRYEENDAFNEALFATAKANARNARNTAAASIPYFFDREFNANNNIVLDELDPPADRNSTEIVYGYVDYVFRLKASNAAKVERDIYFTKLDLTYMSAHDYSTAFRAAVFCEDISSGIVTAGVSEDRLKGIYAFDGARNFTDGKAVNGTDTLGDIVTTVNGSPLLATAAASSASFYKVVVRIWLEGEDMTCTADTFKKLTQDWKLDIELSFDGEYVITTQSINKLTSTIYDSTTYTYDGVNVFNASTATKLAVDQIPAAVKSTFYQSITVPKESDLDVAKTFFYNDGTIFNNDFSPIDPTDGSDNKANKAKQVYYRSTTYDAQVYYFNKGVIFAADWSDVTDTAPAAVKKTFFKQAEYNAETYYCNTDYSAGYAIYNADLELVAEPDDDLKAMFYKKQRVGAVDYYSNGVYVYRWNEGGTAFEQVTPTLVVPKMRYLLEDVFGVVIA